MAGYPELLNTFVTTPIPIDSMLLMNTQFKFRHSLSASGQLTPSKG